MTEIGGIVTTLVVNRGFRVEQTADGRMAAEHVFLLKPDLILIDLHLRGLDGIRAGRLNTPIIVIGAAKEEFDKVLLWRWAPTNWQAMGSVEAPRGGPSK